MKLNVALIAANGVTYPKPRIGMLTSPTYSDDGRITSALFEEEPVMNPVFRTARRADEEDVPAPLMAVEHYDLGVFVDWVWDCNQERLALRAKVKELEAKVSTEAEVPTGDVIYLYRRIGLGRDEWATCDKERFLLLSDNKQFETKYAWPAGTVGMLQACLKESEAENSNLRLQCGGMEMAIDELRAATGGNQSMGDPIPWEHVMYQELDQRHFQLTYTKDNPWGIPGKDYDESYKVVSAPLVRHTPVPNAFSEEQ